MIKRGDIYYIKSGPYTGCEQRPGRPAIIVSNDACNRHSEVLEAVYLTTQPKKDLPTHVNITALKRASTALCEQVTTVSVERLGDHEGHVSDEEMAAMDKAIMISLGIQNVTQDIQEKSKCSKKEPVSIEAQEKTELELELSVAKAKLEMLQSMYDKLLTAIVGGLER